MKEEKRVLSAGKIKSRLTVISAKAVFESVLTAFCVFVFGKSQLIMQTYPLGLSLFCALNKHVLSAAVGLLLSALTLGEVGSMHFAGYAFGILFRIGVNFFTFGKKQALLGRYSDSVASKLASGIVSTLSVSLIRIIGGGFLYYDLLGALFYINCTAFMTWAYSLATDEKYRNGKKLQTGIYALLFSSVLCLRGISFVGLQFSTVAAFFITYTVSRRQGPAWGTVIGLLCGAAIGIDICPMFGLIGLLCGALSSLPAYLGPIISSGLGIVAFAFSGGTQILSQYLPEASAATALFIPLCATGILAEHTVGTSARPLILPAPTEVERTDRLCNSLLYLSDMFSQLAKKQNRPAVHEICDILGNAFSENCKGCSQKTACFGRGKIRDSRCVRQIAENIYKKGICTSCDLTDDIRQSCYFKDRLTAKINISLSRLHEEKSRYGKIDVMEADYAQMAQLLSGAVKFDSEEYSVNEEKTREIKKDPYFRRVFGESIAVYGKRRISVVGAWNNSTLSVFGQADVTEALQDFLGCKLESPDYINDGDRTVVRFNSAPRFKISGTNRLLTKNGERYNGDSADFFTTDEGYYFSVVCDGMGSGDEAALTSGTSAVFLRSLLSAGCEKETVMKCLNNFVAAKGSECFTTADLLCIDTYTGSCSFIKCGACASLVVRGDNIYKLFSHTPPVGIMKELCAEKLEFSLKHGDTVVMMSDGVWDWVKEPTWLYEILTLDRKNRTGQELCDEIVQRAQAEGEDDVTVCIMEIEEF